MLKRTSFLILIIVSILAYSYSLTVSQSKSIHGSSSKSERWIKLDHSGNPISSWSGPWSCIEDTETGLIWEAKNDSENIHDSYWTYSWFNGRFGVANMGDCYFEPNRCDTNDLVKRMNQEQYCGYSNWRLPTSTELQTLVTQPTKTGAPHIRNDYFPHTKHGDYWTSNGQQKLTGAFQHLGYGATAVNFGNGKLVTIPYRNAAFLRLVTKKSY